MKINSHQITNVIDFNGLLIGESFLVRIKLVDWYRGYGATPLRVHLGLELAGSLCAAF
jgi:hypothetical protein